MEQLPYLGTRCALDGAGELSIFSWIKCGIPDLIHKTWRYWKRLNKNEQELNGVKPALLSWKHQVAHSPCTVILPSVLALPAELVAKHMYCPESSAVMLSKMSVQEPSGSSMMMWWGSTSTARPSVCETDGWITLLLRRHQEGKHLRFGSLPLYQVTCGLGAPVTLQASFTVWPSSAVQSVNTASKSGGPVIKVKCSILGIGFIFIVLF